MDSSSLVDSQPLQRQLHNLILILIWDHLVAIVLMSCV